MIIMSPNLLSALLETDKERRRDLPPNDELGALAKPDLVRQG
jgi:hypothetical protein